MATATQTKEKTGSWSSIFRNEQISQTQSALFVKKLLAVSISNVAYLRAIFPEHAFGDSCLEDLNLKLLVDNSSCPGACKVIQWVKGCFDALDKKYLRMLIIGIYVDPEDPDTVIESYTFKFSYADDVGIDIYRNDQKISGAHTIAETKKATIRLLRTIVVLTQTLKSLPDDVMMSMKLLYFDDVTPPDYEPPGFKAADTDTFIFEEEPMNIKVGDVSTPFHSVKMRIKTDRKQFETREVEEEEGAEEIKTEIKDTGLDNDAMDNDAMDQDVPQREVNTEINSRFEIKQHGDSTHETSVVIPDESPAKPGQQSKSQELSQVGENEEICVRCPCGFNEDDGLMILCAVCKFWQHGVCFQILDEDVAPSEHVCDICAMPGVTGKEPTDHHLVSMTDINKQATCLWRRAILASLDLNRVLAPHLARRLGVEATVAQGLINRLEKEGFVRNAGKGKRLGKLVDKDKIRLEAIPKYVSAKKPTTDVHKQTIINEDSQVSMKANTLPVPKKLPNDVDSLVSKTESINLSGKKKKGQSDDNLVNNTQEIRKSQRGKKRAYSKTNETQDFEISASQDQDSFCEPSSRRRRKSSIVNKAIMV